jgi:hypothetical protein
MFLLNINICLLISQLHNIQTTIQCVPEALSPGAKQVGREVDHSPSRSSEIKNGGAIPTLSDMSWASSLEAKLAISHVQVKNTWLYTSTHPYTFIEWYLGIRITSLLTS